MPKLNEVIDPNERAAKINYIKEQWTSWIEIRTQTLSRITNYLFVLNTGGLLGALTYVASKSPNPSIQCSIWLFAAGTFFCLIHATVDYYVTESSFNAYRKDVAEFYENKLNWPTLIDRNERRSRFDCVMHLFGWASAIVFMIGLAVGIPQIK